MNIFLTQHFRKKKELYKENEDVKIIIRVFGSDKKRINITTSVKVQLQNWIPNWKDTHNKNPINEREPDSKSKNLILKTELKRVEDIVFNIQKNDGIPTTDLIKTHLRSNSKKREKSQLTEVHLIILLEKYLGWIKSDDYKVHTQNTDSYIRSLTSSLKDLIRWTEIFQERKGNHIIPEDIDISYVTGLITFCDKRGLQPSTIKKRIKVLNSFSKYLREEMSISVNVPVPKKIFTDIEKNIIFLTRDDILKIDSFKEFDFNNYNMLINSELKIAYEKHMDTSQIQIIKDFTPKLKKTKYRNFTSYEVYKDVLIFLCGTGMRFGDMLNIRVDSKEFDIEDRNKGEFMYQSEKTQKITRVPLNRLTMSIYNKYSGGKDRNDYLFPRTQKGNPISNPKFNKQKKQVCKLIGLNRGVKSPEYNLDRTIKKGTNESVPLWGEISSHIGRKTFIREQIESGTPPRTIMSMTGHKSQKVFDGYYNILKGDRMKNNDKLFSINLNEPKKKPKEGISVFQEEELKKYKSLYDTGLIDKEFYREEVRRILD
ncbi:tyrosine-type recombinase/integrase [Candidatus Kaiserbacteria bacterium]|nr:tyrosine-type recombinase/integrase [Candidatus Kaiserbacteria bacterium]